MSWKELLLGFLVGCTLTGSVYFAFAGRYEILRQSDLRTMKLDRWTGQTWTLANGMWYRIEDSGTAYIASRP